MNRKSFKLIFMACITVLSIVSCSKDDDSNSLKNYQLTQIPTNVNDLFVGKGLVAKDTVIVYAEGGPEPLMSIRDIEEPQFSNYYRAYVKQAQHINPTISNNEITFEQAIEENDISTEMYQKVLRYFKDDGKYVIAMSHSFGSFILPNVLDKNPNIADKVIIMAGRLDMPDIVWQGFRDGVTYGFPDGVTPTQDDGNAASGGALSGNRLQGALGKNRYTQLLQDNDISNLVYVYGTKDQAVGSLTSTEADFLVSKNADVIYIEEGDHSSMFTPQFLDYLLNLIRQ